MIQGHVLETIRGKLDIVELVSQYVPQVQRAGRNMKARCPFHQERTPSFVVNPERQTFHCFGCGEGGDAFSFLMKIENLSFHEAAQKLAERVGVPLAEAEGPVGPEEKLRLRLKELLDFASRFYHEKLKSPQGAQALGYLKGRHVSEASIDAFRLGLAPRSAGFLEAAARKGYSREELAKAGLAAPSREAGRLRDYFYDRILFPIWDAKGAVVGFGARAMGDAQPKYLNSPDSPVFTKGRVLYGLFQGLAAVRKARKAILMEGYMDVIAAHQHGVNLACAPLGTALTQEQSGLIKRYASEATIVFDSDSAGLAAAIRGAEVLLAAGLSVRIATVPQGKDPDEHLHNFGVSSFEKCLAAAVDLVEFKTERLLAGEAAPLRAEAKSRIAKQVLATIEQCPDEILKGEWASRLAQRLSISEESLRREMGKTEPANRRPGMLSRSPRPEAVLPEIDQQMLILIFKEPRLAGLVRAEDFTSAAARRIWQDLAAMNPLASDWAARLLEGLAQPVKTEASRLMILMAEMESSDPEGVLKAVLSRRRGLARLKEIEPQVLAMGYGRAMDPGLQDEYRRLLLELKGSRRS
ncbi:MAG: DNA primase [Elusimicrobia bacterium]|nr:DNA primase [Elusimicrobiota bacterium]